jgi:4-amino-4-deoxy-L-arabinose transferase-like glycosyltransferase
LPPRRFALLLFVLALLIRMAAVLAMRDVHVGPTGPGSVDDVQFNNLALRLVEGQGYVNYQGRPTSFRAPGFPFFLAGLYAAFGTQPAVVYTALCALGALTCVVAYGLARELLSETAARIAGLLASIYLGHIYFATLYISENLFVPCLGLGIWLLIRHLKSGAVGVLAGAGLVLGGATLTRPFALLLLPLLLLVLLARSWRAGRLGIGVGAIFSVAFLAVLLPWTCRNYQAHGRLVLLASNGGSTFYGGNNARVVRQWRYFGYWLSTADLPHRDLIDGTPDEIAHDRMEWKLGMDWLKDNLGAIPHLLLLKALRMWWLPQFDAGRLGYLLRMVGYAPFLLLFVLGFARLLHGGYWSSAWWAVHAAMLATVISVLIFWGCTRFRDANHPLLMLYAALGVEVVLASAKRCVPFLACSGRADHACAH